MMLVLVAAGGWVAVSVVVSLVLGRVLSATNVVEGDVAHPKLLKAGGADRPLARPRV